MVSDRYVLAKILTFFIFLTFGTAHAASAELPTAENISEAFGFPRKLVTDEIPTMVKALIGGHPFETPMDQIAKPAFISVGMREVQCSLTKVYWLRENKHIKISVGFCPSKEFEFESTACAWNDVMNKAKFNPGFPGIVTPTSTSLEAKQGSFVATIILWGHGAFPIPTLVIPEESGDSSLIVQIFVDDGEQEYKWDYFTLNRLKAAIRSLAER